ERVGRSKPAVSNRLRLLELPDEVLWMVARGELTEGHARAVLAVPDHDSRRRLARRIAREGLSVRAAEQAARRSGARQRPRESLEAITQDADARQIFLRMAAMSRSGRTGSLVSEIAHDDDLDEDTKGTLTELARDRSFLLAVEDYMQRTRVVH